uniref:Ras-GAP domain-containing protein n=1 Tax=Gongylonema pulchrum TaxID=637853 RepID=A0A183CY58_9BILA
LIAVDEESKSKEEQAISLLQTLWNVVCYVCTLIWPLYSNPGHLLRLWVQQLEIVPNCLGYSGELYKTSMLS